MDSNPFVVVITGVAIVNGIFSPLFLPQAVAMMLTLAPGLLIASPDLVLSFPAFGRAAALLLG
jgi:hypothetical protein